MVGPVEHAIPEEAQDFWTEDGQEHVGWFCVRTDPFPCPAPDCEFVAEFMTAAHRLAVLAVGSPPTATEPPRFVPSDRVALLKERLGPELGGQSVCGLHVHLSVPDPDTCLRAFEGIVPHLPHLLAQSANSPYR